MRLMLVSSSYKQMTAVVDTQGRVAFLTSCRYSENCCGQLCHVQSVLFRSVGETRTEGCRKN
jgi:hypothetical protein